MDQTSKFHIINVYAWLSFLLTITGCTLYFMIRSVALQINYDSNFSAASASLVILIMICFGLFKLAKNVAIMIITFDTITIRYLFKKERINKKEIQQIDLFARINTGTFKNRTHNNGIRILLKNQVSFFLPDLYYRNSPALKTTLLKNFTGFVKDEQQYNNTGSLSVSSYDTKPKIFSGNFLISFNGFLIMLPLAACLFLLKDEKSQLLWLIMSLCFLLFFILTSFRAYYFVIFGDELEVKNQIWWWKKTVYNVSQIKNIIIEKRYRQPTSLQINTTDFHSYNYPAGSLRNQTWQRFIAECKARRIEVYNEAFI